MRRLASIGIGVVAVLLAVTAVAAARGPQAQPLQARPAAKVTAAEERIWQEYVEFGKGKEGPDVAKAYREKLIADGMTEAQAWDRIFLIDRLRGHFRQATWTAGFNRLYTSSLERFSTAPNAFLASVIQGLTPGAALDVSMGQGRNTVFLATRGWKATGFDPAEEGLVAAREAAAKSGVAITAVNSTYEAFDFGVERWDLVVFCYAFAPLSDASLVDRVHRSLRPGGLVLIEHPMNEPDKAMHPHDRVNSLPTAFARRFRIVLYEDTTGFSEWQQSTIDRAEDRRRMVRLVARKEIDR